MKQGMMKLINKAKYASTIAAIALMTAPVHADIGTFGTASNIKTVVEKLLNLVFGFFAVFGVVQLVLGIYNWVSGSTGDQSDAQKVSKGQGEVVRGVIMVLAVAVLTFLGLGPQNIVNTYFR